MLAAVRDVSERRCERMRIETAVRLEAGQQFGLFSASAFSSAMSLFGNDADVLFANYMRQMRQMNNMMMSSVFCDPFGMMGDMGNMGMPLSIMGPQHAQNRMMPFMPDLNLNRMMAGGLDGMMNERCNSYSSSTIVMSNGPDGRPQVYSSTSSTNIGPGGVKETRRTVEDSVSGTKKMSIGHHINERAHVVEREQNVRSGDLEERQEFINIEEEEADEFNREFEQAIGARGSSSRARIMPARQAPLAPLLALPAPPPSSTSRRSGSSSIGPRRPLRQQATPALPASSSYSTSAGVRHTYGSVQPQRSKQRGSKNHHNNTNDY